MRMDRQQVAVTSFVTCFVIIIATSVPGSRGQIPNLAFNMMEELPVGTLVGDIVASAQLRERYGAYELLKFSLQPGPYSDYFSIDRHSGLLSLAKVLDRDKLAPNAEVFQVTLNAALHSPEFDQFKVTVTVNDSNDNAPTFEQRHVTLSVSELAGQGASLMIPAALDPDSPDFAVQNYRLQLDPLLNDEFELRLTRFGQSISDVRLVLRQQLDRERRKEYVVTVVASDGGEPAREGTATVTILVLDANDNGPTFEQDKYEVSLPEDMEVNVPFMRVHASDLDDGFNGLVSYEFATQTLAQHGGMFNLNGDTGEISLSARVKYDAQRPFYNLLVLAHDMGSNPFSANALVTINVIDINDHAPKITVTALSASGRPEVVETIDDVGTVAAYVTVQDDDTGSTSVMTCVTTGSAFLLLPVDINEYKLMSREVFDRESKASYRLNVTCMDGGRPPLTSSTLVVVDVADINDNAPHFREDSYRVKVKEGSLSRDFLTVSATDADTGDNAIITYAIYGTASHYFTIDPTSGMLSSIAALDHEAAPQMQFVVTARDQGSQSLSSSTVVIVDVIDVNDEAPKFESNSYVLEVEEERAPGALVGSVSATDRDSPPFARTRYSLAGAADVLACFQIQDNTGMITTRRPLNREQRATYQMTVVATDTSEPFWTTSVNVTVNVADINDNAPFVYFPAAGNGTTFLVSPRSRPGSKVTPIYASDKDSGRNARLSYAIFVGDDEFLYSIDQARGELSVRRDLRNYSSHVSNVTILVTDDGERPLSTAIWLRLIVNDSVAPDWSEAEQWQRGGGGGLSTIPSLRKHELFIALLASLTLVIVFILVLAIVCVAMLMMRRNRRDADLLAAEVKKDAAMYSPASIQLLMMEKGNNAGSPIKDNRGRDEDDEDADESNRMICSPSHNTYVSFSGRNNELPVMYASETRRLDLVTEEPMSTVIVSPWTSCPSPGTERDTWRAANQLSPQRDDITWLGHSPLGQFPPVLGRLSRTDDTTSNLSTSDSGRGGSDEGCCSHCHVRRTEQEVATAAAPSPSSATVQPPHSPAEGEYGKLNFELQPVACRKTGKPSCTSFRTVTFK